MKDCNLQIFWSTSNNTHSRFHVVLKIVSNFQPGAYLYFRNYALETHRQWFTLSIFERLFGIFTVGNDIRYNGQSIDYRGKLRRGRGIGQDGRVQRWRIGSWNLNKLEMAVIQKYEIKDLNTIGKVESRRFGQMGIYLAIYKSRWMSNVISEL